MRRPEGFTIVELVVILTIIAVLTAISVPMGLNWIGTHRFTVMARAFPNAVLMARMRGIENRQVVTITGSANYSGTLPFSTCCPGIVFTTSVDHGLSGPNPALTNNLVCSSTVGCPSTYCSPLSNSSCRKSLVSSATTAGDTVMLSGLDRHLSMNGVEYEVLKVPDSTHFVVQRAYTGGLGDVAGSDTAGVVRELTAPGRLRIVPAAAVTTATTVDNQENFQASDYTVKEEGPNIVFRYNADKFKAYYFDTGGNPQLLSTASSPQSYQLTFDNRGFPLAVTGVPNVQSILIEENVPSGEKKAPRRVRYQISISGKVDTLVSGAPGSN
jgi:type II secretory pathway pseudopilin PulG